MRHISAAIFIILLFAVPWMMCNPEQSGLIFSTIQNIEDQLASVNLAHNPKTIAEIKSHYDNSGVLNAESKKVRILLVPGHEPDYGGAEYGTIKERYMTVKLAKDLQQMLKQNGKYEVVVTRDDKSWDPTFANYFKTEWDDIITWYKGHKVDAANMIKVGVIKPIAPKVIHNTAPAGVATRLYGIGKWANENNMDVVIHMHLNDNPGHARNDPGKYSGISIYVPQKDFYNSPVTKALADSVMKRLEKYNPVSDLPGESGGIVEDQDLIAIGANNSVDAASMLIEYGYIYESQFNDPSLYDQALKDLAFQTYLGLQDFFDPHNVVSMSGSFDSLLIPHKWTSTLSEGVQKASDIYAMQTALVSDGVYPPVGKSMNDCPRTGTIGVCTKAALESFQNKYGIVGEKGIVGNKTIQMLNKLYGGVAI